MNYDPNRYSILPVKTDPATNFMPPNAAPPNFMGRIGGMQPLPIRGQIAQQMTQPMLQPAPQPITSGFQGNTGLPVDRGQRRTIQPVMPGMQRY